MKISLLYKNEEKSAVTDAIYNLSIDRCAAVFCPDSARYDRFISVLSRPLTDPENILYRQAILNDFLNNPKLFDELKTIFLRYDKIKADWIELRSGAHVNEKGSSEAILSQTYSSLKVTSVFPRTIMSFFTSISDTLSSYKLSSPGLIYIRDYACRMLSDNNLEEIGKISALFVYNEADDYNYEVAISLSDDFKITGCELTNIEPKPKKQLLERQHKQYEKQLRQLYEEQMEPEKPESTDKKENKLYRLISGLSTKTKEKLNTESVIDRESFDTVMYILTEALSQIDNTLTKIHRRHIRNFSRSLIRNAVLRRCNKILRICRFCRSTALHSENPANGKRTYGIRGTARLISDLRGNDKRTDNSQRSFLSAGA